MGARVAARVAVVAAGKEARGGVAAGKEAQGFGVAAGKEARGGVGVCGRVLAAQDQAARVGGGRKKKRLVAVRESDKPAKKLVAVFRDEDTGRESAVHFGARGMSDYTVHRDAARRERYRARHARDLRTGDPTRAGYLAWHVLWGPTTSVKKNVAAYRAKFGL